VYDQQWLAPLWLVQGDVHKRKEIVQDVTLHDLDAANARPQVIGIALLDANSCSGTLLFDSFCETVHISICLAAM
jgi:DNA helicase TIP49 (TBP-interacting protein)